MVEIPTYQIGIFVFDLTFSIEKKYAKTRPECVGDVLPGCVLSVLVAFLRPWANDHLKTRRISEPACRFGVISIHSLALEGKKQVSVCLPCVVIAYKSHSIRFKLKLGPTQVQLT